MKTNEKIYRIYLKHDRQWVEVSEEVYKDHTRFCDRKSASLMARSQYPLLDSSATAEARMETSS